MKISEISIEHLDRVERLWTELKHYQQSCTNNFKRYYDELSFEQRKAALLAKARLAIFIAELEEENDPIGFCIASCNLNSQIEAPANGEIDSLFILPKFGGHGVGTELVEHALNWLNENSAQPIRLSVGDGNEAVFSFYKKLGFVKRATVLELV